MSKNILIVNGNPKAESFCQHLTDSYVSAAKKTFNIKSYHLSTMTFNPNLETGYDTNQALETCLSDFQQAVLWAEHLVIITPIWWGGIPAKLKGLIDRTFLSNFGFKYEGDSLLPTQLLQGKTSRLIITMDSPPDYSAAQAAPVLSQLDDYTLQFCGIEKAATTLIGSIILASEEEKQQWQQQVARLGHEGL